jgi:DNA excision repair protein ERCC-3
VAALVSNPRGIVKSPAGSGKTIIGAAALDRFVRSYWFSMAPLFRRLGRPPAVMWLANTQEQLQQAREAVAGFPDIVSHCRLTTACYAGIPDCREAVLVILDECHHVASPEYRRCLDGCGGWRWGLSATPERADDLAADVYTLIGPIVSSLAEPLIQLRIRKWRRVSPEDIRSRTTWHFCQQIGIFENAKRNAKIVRLALEHAGDSTLILVGSIEHGKTLAERIGGAVVAYSKMGVKKRRDALEGFKAGSIRCMIATSLADEGLDVPRANVLILASGGRSSRLAEQRSGRVLRAWADKTHGTIHDFADGFHFYNAAQARARRAVYASLGYEIAEAVIDGGTPSLFNAQRATLPQVAPH